MSNIFNSFGKVVKLANTSDKRAMILDMVVCDSLPNINKDQITAESIKANIETLLDMPLQVDKFRLENGLYSSLTHRAEKGELKTDSIGTIYKVWHEEDEETGVVTAFASAKVWKRYPKTCEAIVELHEQGNLKFSWELLAEKMEKIDGINVISEHTWVGNCIVSNPSYPIAKSTLLVAELKEMNLEEEVKSLDEFLIAGMSEDMLRTKINAKLGYDKYVTQTFIGDNKVIVREWSEDEYYIVEFTVSGDEVEVMMDSKVKGALVWKSIDEISELDLRVAELETANVELQAKVDELTSEKEVDESVEAEKCEDDEMKAEEESTTTVAEEDVVVKYAETITTLAETVKVLESKIAELEPYRLEALKLAEEKALAELAERKEVLTQMAKSVLAEAEEMTEQMSLAVENMDERELKIAIAEYTIEKYKSITHESKSIVAEVKDKDVIIGATDGSDYNLGSKPKIELV